jgi:hypothetical protein
VPLVPDVPPEPLDPDEPAATNQVEPSNLYTFLSVVL